MTGNSRFAVSVHILAYLAYQKARAVPSAEIASSVSTNPVVIRRLLSSMVKAGLVSATKGASGGFALARDSATISLLDIYRAAEPDPRDGMDHFAPNHHCPVGAKIESILEITFTKAQEAMEAEIARVSLSDVDRQLHSVCPKQAHQAANGALSTPSAQASS